MGTLLLSDQANSASFDCNKAAIWSEKTICKNPELSKLDDAMAAKYKKKLARAADYEDSKAYKKEVMANQQAWLKFQRNTCKDTKCLSREYAEYITERYNLHKAWVSVSDLRPSDLPDKNAFGKFSKTH